MTAVEYMTAEAIAHCARRNGNPARTEKYNIVPTNPALIVGVAPLDGFDCAQIHLSPDKKSGFAVPFEIQYSGDVACRPCSIFVGSDPGNRSKYLGKPAWIRMACVVRDAFDLQIRRRQQQLSFVDSALGDHQSHSLTHFVGENVTEIICIDVKRLGNAMNGQVWIGKMFVNELQRLPNQGVPKVLLDNVPDSGEQC